MNALVPLETLAKEINACHDKADGYDKKAEEFRTTRDQKIHEAHERITAGEIETTFKAWCEANLTISRARVFQIVKRLAPPKVVEPPQPKGGIPVDQSEVVMPSHAPVDLSTLILPEPPDPVGNAYTYVESTLTEDQFIELTKRMVKRCNEIAEERKLRAPAWRESIDKATARPGTEEFQIERSAFYLARKKQQEEQGF